MNHAHSAVGDLVAVLILVATIFTLLFFVFTYINSVGVNVANSYAPGSLSTADYYIFSQFQTFSVAIVAFCMFLIAINVSKRSSE